MILSQNNYDGYKEFDMNRKLRDEEKQVRLMKQEIMKQQLVEQTQLQEQRKKELQLQKQREDEEQIQLIRKKQGEEKFQQIQNKETMKQNLQQQNHLILNHQKLIIDEKKQETLKIENDIINNAINGLSLEEQMRRQKREMQKQIVEQQMKELQQRKEKEKKDKEFEQLIYKEQTQNESLRIQKQEDSYRNYYQKLSERQNALQDIYRQKVDNPKLYLDQMINKQVKERQDKEETEYLTRRSIQQKQKEMYQNGLANQIYEQNEKKKQEDNVKEQRKQEILQASLLFEEQQRLDRLRKREIQQQYHTQLSSLSQSQSQSSGNLNTEVSQSNIYNPLTNPNPSQIQNPYILRQIQHNNGNLQQSQSMSQSKLASFGKSSLLN
ncbi:unnamed protein product (macronuclear) [Paramecium tetraurelia]|uniref:Trichohyalin-plectin-homology domain-containing protein n=1 Tax=Paramecium tetraurelia TaxID=5888 RepID=A0CNB8_PARTE|nr:uncharacterized protein GSPATT00008727001 [Paramecium tetraurelia]CAK72285.1 unnamed protein product [Paramecium tetraurelia]|eukprot:XP_001439682.1 hypothetical protein (macronuclear) [Paramecium tetraurelia strain d4-2]